jgi:hypothetical protein
MAGKGQRSGRKRDPGSSSNNKRTERIHRPPERQDDQPPQAVVRVIPSIGATSRSSAGASYPGTTCSLTRPRSTKEWCTPGGKNATTDVRDPPPLGWICRSSRRRARAALTGPLPPDVVIETVRFTTLRGLVAHCGEPCRRSSGSDRRSRGLGRCRVHRRT